MRANRLRASIITVCLTGALATAPAAAQDRTGAKGAGDHPVRNVTSPMVWFNQDYIEGLYTNIDIKKPMNIFRAVFARLRPAAPGGDGLSHGKLLLFPVQQ